MLSVEAALKTIVLDARVVIPLRDLPDVFARKPSDATAILGALIREELAVVWPEAPEGPALVLTAFSAEMLGVRANSMGRLVPVGKEDPQPRSQPPRYGVRTVAESDLRPHPDGTAHKLDDHVDRNAMPPVVEASWGEANRSIGRSSLVLRYGETAIPEPRQLLGIGLSWPVRRGPGELCPGCGGRKLTMNEVCLIDSCLRSGVDCLIPTLRPHERPRKVYDPDSGLDDGIKRKDRRTA
jgi:hypothetical protein